MPTFLPSGIRDELDALTFDNTAQDDIAHLDWNQRSLDDIGRLSAPAPTPAPTAQAFSTPDAPVLQAPTPTPLGRVRPLSTPQQMASTWQSGNGGTSYQDTGDTGDASVGGPTPPPSPRLAAPPPGGPLPQAGGDLPTYARAVAARYGIDPDIFVRQIQQESGFNPQAQSPAGAQGIAQFMPDTARGFGLADPFEPYSALDAAARYMRQNLDANNGDYRFALASYNAGQGNVDRYGEGVFGADFANGQTRDYVDRILGPGSSSRPSATPSPAAAAATSGDVAQAALDDPDKWALCGPVAAIIAAGNRGANWSIAQAKRLATDNGLWDAGTGMHGLGTEVDLLNRMGVNARTGDADPATLAADALAGNTPIVSTALHYFILKGYDAATGLFDTSTSGTALKGGSRWLSLDQIARLGRGIQGAAYIDNPSSPVSSVATRDDATSGPQPAQAISYRMPLGAGAANTRAASESPQDASGAIFNAPVDSGSGGAFQDDYTNAGQTPSPLSDASATVSDASAPIAPPPVAYPSAGGGGFQDDYSQSGWVQPDMAPGPPLPAGVSTPDTGIDWLQGIAPNLGQTVVDTAANLGSRALGALQSAGSAIASAPPTGLPSLEGLRSAASVAAPVVSSMYHGDVGQAILDASNRMNADTKDLLTRRQQILDQADLWAKINGRPDPTFGVVTVNDPGWRAANPDLADEWDQLNQQFTLAAGQASMPLEAARAAVPGLQAAQPAIGRGIDAVRGALGQAGAALDENAARIAAADAARAGQPSVSAPGVFGVAPPEAGPAAEAVGRPRFVPPEVRMQTSPVLELPSDPRFAQAVEASGGRMTAQGAEIYTTRAQGPEAAGGLATRGGVFAEAVPEGGQSSYVRTGKASTGGSQVIPPTKTLLRRPLAIAETPGVRGFLDDGLQQLGITGTDGTPLTGRAPIDEAVNAIRARTQEGSPERAQALKDLVSQYGGDPSLVEPLMALRPNQTESGYAIVENILFTNARRQGYDSVVYLKEHMRPPSEVAHEPEIQQARAAYERAHQAYEEARQAHLEANQRYWQLDNERRLDPSKTPEYYRASEESFSTGNRSDRLGSEAARAEMNLTETENKYRRTHKIQEMADLQQGRNPTPGAPAPRNPEAEAAVRAATDRVSAAKRAAEDMPSPETQAAFRAAIQNADEARRALQQAQRNTGPPGYFLHPDVVPPSQGAAATAGIAPVPVRAHTDVLASVNRALSQGVASAVSGGVGAATADQLGDPNDPNRRLKGFVAGAALPFLASRGARALAGRFGAEAGRAAEGALASFGTSPHYVPPAAAKVAAEAARGPADGARLNRTVSRPPSDVPARVRAVTATTDDRAALRWAEDMLSSLAGGKRLPEDSPLRPSTQSRVSSGAVANERIDNGLAPALVDAARAGLQDELPQHLRDQHAKDILDEFYNRGYNESMAQSQQRTVQAQANNRPPAVIARLQAQAQADAEKAGLAKMRTRQGSNPDMTYEAIDARLQGQEQRLKADGRWQQLQDAAQAVWDHNAETRQRLVQAGEMDPSDAAYYAQSYPHYVPTQPISHLDARSGAGPASGGPGVSRGTSKVVRALEDVGTSGETLNPIVASRMATVRAERAIARNQTARAFAQMFDDAYNVNPQALGTGPQHRTFLGGGVDVTFNANGQTHTISVPKPIADGLESASQMGVDPNGFAGFLRRVTRAVTSTLTASRASFIPVNVLRDASDYAAQTMAREGNNPTRLPSIMNDWAKEAGNATLDILRAQARPRSVVGGAIGAATGAAAGDENTTVSDRVRHAAEGYAAGSVLLGANRVGTTGRAAEFLARGGGSGGIANSLGASQRWYRDVMRSGGTPVRNVGDAANYLRDWFGDVASLQGVKGINERAETIARTAAMNRAERAGASPTEAMIAGRNASYDADRAGTLTRSWNGFIPFLNATVQGGAQFVRMLQKNPVGTTAAVVSTLGPVMAATEAWNRSDPQRAQAYDDVPQYVKDSGLVVMAPWAGTDTRGGRPNYLWLPTEVLTPFVVGMRAAMQHADAVVPGIQPSAGRSDANPNSAAPQLLGAANEALSIFYPVRGDSAASLASTLVPPIARQAIELSMNKDLFRGGAIQSAAADERASSFGRAVSGAANAAGRALGSDFLQNVHPSQVDYLARQAPSYGDIITGASDLLAPGPFKQAEQGRVANEPFLGGIANRFVRDTGGANLERAQGQMVTPMLQQVMQEARMRPGDVDLTAPSDYKGAPLTRDEQLRWQRAFGPALAEQLGNARDTRAWDDPTTRAQAVKDAVSKAREQAAKDVLDLTSTDIRDRVELEQSRQRAVAR